MTIDKINLLKEICLNLNLNYESQDWGIINSCHYRVEEFINYFNNNGKYPDTIKYELFELIIASFNDLILEKKDNNIIVNIFTNFILENKTEPFIDILNYWKKIYNDEEFPVAKYFPVI